MSDLILLNNNTVTKDTSGQLVTTSLAIAEGTEVIHKNILELVRKYIADLTVFGRVAFETQSFDTVGGIQNREIAYLNEQQSSLLIAYMRNSDLVRSFKIGLIKEFFNMRSQLQNNFVLPTNFLEALKLLVEKEEENIQLKLDVSTLDATITKQAPAVEFAMAVRNLDGSCDIGEFAGVIGVGRNTLFKKMREDKLLMVTNRPYQKYKDNGVFVEIENIPFIDRLGKSHPTFQTRVTGKGQILLENKYRSLNPFADFLVDD